MTTLAVAGLSVRAMAQSAAAAGHDVVALDLFGDIDTRAAATRWFGIGEPAGLCIDGQRLLWVLARLAQQEGVFGWVAGSGFDGRPDLLAAGAALLPLIGMAADEVARLRDPRRFFAVLADLDIEHPPVCLSPAGAAGAWLCKDLHDSGGRHIRRLPAECRAPPPPTAGLYLQREVGGRSMSATYVADGVDARLLGVNEQIVRPLGESPFVFCGVIGPLPVADAVRQRLQATLRRLTPAFALRGLGSLDFMLDGGSVQVLEINPRPAASLACYPTWQPLAAHLRACLAGELPPPRPAPALRHGHETVFAPRPLWLDRETARRLAALPGVHDLPRGEQTFAGGHPLCSVSAAGDCAAEVHGGLLGRRRAVLELLESAPCR